jgi:putative transposase
LHRETDRYPIPEVAKRNGLSKPSIYAWKECFGEMATNDVKRLKILGAENAQLKKMVAERDFEMEVIKEIAIKNGEHIGEKRAGIVCY